MSESSQGLYAVVFLVLILTAAGFAMAFYSLQNETKYMRGQQVALLGKEELLGDLAEEVCASWASSPKKNEAEADLLSLARAVAHCFPKLLNSAGTPAQRIGLHRYRIAKEDFVMAGLGGEFSKIQGLLARIDEPTLSQLWESPRMLDLMSMLRFVQSRMYGSSPAELNAAPVSGKANTLLSLLREEADATVICSEIQAQSLLDAATEKSTDPNPQCDLALHAIVEALSFRRNGLGKPFTLAVLVLALSGRGLEDLYRECRHDAETVNGSWREQFNNLRTYVESLPGWDGRLPFSDMMVATHNSYVARSLSVLMRVL